MHGNVVLSSAFSPAVSNANEATNDLYVRSQQTFTKEPISNYFMFCGPRGLWHRYSTLLVQYAISHT